MRLVRLGAQRFRNLDAFERAIEASFVVIHGANAQGKTNLLEAIFLLSTLKPLRARRPRDLIRWESDKAAISGTLRSADAEVRLKVRLDGASRQAEIDEKPADLALYFRWARAVAFVPSDVGIVTGEPARRRNWVDRAAFTAHPAHLDAVRRYKRALDQKAAALRSQANNAVLDVLDETLAREGARLIDRRAALLHEIGPHVRAIHLLMAAERGGIALRYRTLGTGDSVDARANALLAHLASHRERERERRQTLIGPHLDDVEIAVEDRSARSWGSQGQVRTAVLALKVAEMVAAQRRGGEVPLFLLDDVGSELDRDRKRRLVEVLRELRAQVFMTTTDPEHLTDLPPDDRQFLRVEGGRIHGP